MRKQAYSILVYNNPGLLSRMAGLFSRRGYNIESITAGTTADPRFTRITIVASGDEQILSQIEKQVRKMEDVIEIKPLNDSNSVCRFVQMHLKEQTLFHWQIFSVRRSLMLKKTV